MLSFKEQFIGHYPSHFEANPVVKAFIVSETFYWSAWNFVAPLFTIFVVNNAVKGNIQIAASMISGGLIARVVIELLVSKFITNSTMKMKLFITILGFILTSLGYLGLAMSKDLLIIFVDYSLVLIGLGLASPAKNSLFSTHLDKNKEAKEWGIYDAIVLIGMAATAALGGFIANQYGFSTLFVIASIINSISILPYYMLVKY